MRPQKVILHLFLYFFVIFPLERAIFSNAIPLIKINFFHPNEQLSAHKFGESQEILISLLVFFSFLKRV